MPALRSILPVAFVLLTSSWTLSAQSPTAPTDELKFEVIVSRHGVRSPTGKVDQLNQFAAQPWPKWAVPPGYLTEHGTKLMTLFGAYDRELLSKQGLLSATGCDDANRVTIIADSDQRTRETGKAIAKGLMPGCSLEVHAQPEGTADPLFHSLEAGVGHPDKALATAAVAGRIGNNPSGLTQAYRPQLQILDDVLSGSDHGTCATASSATAQARTSLFAVPSSLEEGKGSHLVDLHGPLSIASTMSENLLLEYTDGMDNAQVGWGRVDITKLMELLQLHTASSDLERRTNYLARVQASNLLSHILSSMQQEVSQQPTSGALTRPTDRLLILVGHDTNLTNISGTLDLSWLIDGRRDDTPPGGAIVFELWKKAGKDEYRVRTYYTAQTLDQMRNMTPLTLKSPPERATVFVPKCSEADGSCPWKAFESAVRSAIEPAFVK
jgi:4-phytase / acid phosphatase